MDDYGGQQSTVELRSDIFSRWSYWPLDKQKRAFEKLSLFADMLEFLSLRICPHCHDIFIHDDCLRCCPPATDEDLRADELYENQVIDKELFERN